MDNTSIPQQNSNNTVNLTKQPINNNKSKISKK